MVKAVLDHMLTVEDWHAVLRVNLSGAFYIFRTVLSTVMPALLTKMSTFPCPTRGR
jgi:NAD(P)-dependent dehydrogenase (short-subunit alcohol dehydrogenase family)